jgi:pilus assembly protein CpaB
MEVSMKKIYIIAAISAILCGVLLYLFLSGYEKKDTSVDTVQETEIVVVAATNIDADTEITSEMVKETSVPKGSAHSSAAHSLDEVIGKYTDSRLVANEQILTEKLISATNSGAGLSYQIKDGMRAMTISTDAIAGVGGYLEVGDLIDIISIINDSETEEIKVGKKKKKLQGVVTTILIKGAPILKLGSSSSTGEGVYDSVTLLLTPKQCTKLAAAEQLGTLKITLRKKKDDSEINIGPFSSSDLIN